MLLFVTDRGTFGKTAFAHLFARGLFCRICPYQNARFCCDKFDVGGVVLDCVDCLPQGEALCSELRACYPELPIAALVKPLDVPNLPAERILRDTEADSFADAVALFYQIDCGWQAHHLCTYSLSLTEHADETRYMGYPLPLSKREHALLRCLFYRSPRTTTVRELSELCMPEENVGAETVRACIRSINRHAMRISPHPLIVNLYGKGYRLREDVLM